MIKVRRVLFFALAAGLLRVAAQTSPPKSEFRRTAMLYEGNVQKGRQLFNDDKRLACTKCHSVDGTASKAGPDLFAVGDKFGRGEIIDSILNPSAVIAEGYGITIIVTKTGDEFVGVVKHATDTEIELMDGNGLPVRIATADIAERRVSEVSMMPEGLEKGLSKEEFNDLIEYLATLRQPESAAMEEHGMPRDIAPLTKPLELRAFIADELKFEHPVWFGPVPGETNVFLVAEHETGKIWRLEKGNPDRKTLFASLGVYQKGTRGLLGMVMHPKIRENRRYFYVRHFLENGKYSSVVFEGEAAPDLKADSGKLPRVIMKFNNTAGVHYGGGLEFGPDGYFYIAMGDTGPQEDPNGNAQNTHLLMGKVLCVDVDHHEQGKPYSIPPDNPFVGRANYRPEIWALGFRAPWRINFDSLTGDLWIGDVGQDRYEEVDLVRRGENHGWNIYEGFERFSNRFRREGETFVPPVFAYARKFGPSVTGGFVFRGDPHSSFYGVYIFGDYESKRIFGLTQKNRHLEKIRQLAVAPQRIASFGQDARGELFLVGYEGMIYHLELSGASFE
jgi:putative heme-binding domain-containing protein